MDAAFLKEYLSAVLQAELDIYVQQRTISQMTHRYNSLAIKKSYTVPTLNKPDVSYMACAIPTGIVIGGVSCIMNILDNFQKGGGLFRVLAGMIASLIYGVLWLFVGGAVLGLVLWLVLRAIAQKKENDAYEERVQAYEENIRQDKARVAREQQQKDVLGKQIAVLRTCLKHSSKTLNELYVSNVLDSEYRNIIAVSSLLGYLTKGRTQSLQFDPTTGDKGGYNIYENERRLDQIITNTEEILHSLDRVLQNQYELANGLQKANKQINALCGTVNAQLQKISGTVSSIERNQEIMHYQSECQSRQLAYLTWLHTYY